MLLFERLERVAQRLQHSLSTEVRATDTYTYNYIGLCAQLRSHALNLRKLTLGNRRGEIYPTEEVVAGTLARVQKGIGTSSGSLHITIYHYARMGRIKLYQLHIYQWFILIYVFTSKSWSAQA